jgi:hypothetical protein
VTQGSDSSAAATIGASAIVPRAAKAGEFLRERYAGRDAALVGLVALPSTRRLIFRPFFPFIDARVFTVENQGQAKITNEKPAPAGGQTMANVQQLTAGLDNLNGIAGDYNIFQLTPATLQATDTVTGGAASPFVDNLEVTATGTLAASQFQG